MKLCNDTIEECANLLDNIANRQEKDWLNYLDSGGKGPATTFHTIPRKYAEDIRKLKWV